MYNGLLYFAIGSYLSYVWVVYKEKYTSVGSKILEILCFSAVLSIFAGLYYLLEVNVNNTSNFFELYTKLAEVNYLGGYTYDNILSSMESNFWGGINWVVGFYYTSKYPFWISVKSQVDLPLGSDWINPTWSISNQFHFF